MINTKTLFLVSFFTTSFCIYSAELIKGDVEENTTFSFPIKAHVMSSLGNFYVGANQPLTTKKEFAFSALAHTSNKFQGLAPEKININGNKEQINPLFGAHITNLSLLKSLNGADIPIITYAENPASVSILENIASQSAVMLFSTPPLHDAQGAISSGIVALETNITAHVFAAVQPALGIFGQNNSGIALITKGTVGSDNVFKEVDASTGKLVPDPKALPLDVTSQSLIIGPDNLASVAPLVSLSWDDSIKRLFIGLQTTANSGPADGTRAIAVGVLAEDNNGLSLIPIAPDTVFTQSNAIVGIQQPSATVSASLIKPMFTSTALHYLIVVSGTTNSANNVFALPLVNDGPATGTIADKNAVPKNIFQDSTDVPKLINRIITEPALTPEQMTHTTDIAAQIGGGTLLAGFVSDLIIRDDTVFVYVANSPINATGIYSSQAIFDASGKITSWTQWQRAGGTTDASFFGALNTYEGNIIFTTGTDENNINTVKRTEWSNGDPNGLLPVTTFINEHFFINNGGVQSMKTFLPSTPGLHDIALVTMGGIGQIALIQTGTLSSATLIPTPAAQFANIQIFNNGTITEDVNASIVLISGGALDNVGPITTTEIGTDGTTAWLFVGGSTGLAVLADSTGGGWDVTDNQLGDHLTGITAGMSFKTLGNYSFIKKIISDGTFLYIITHDFVDKIDLTMSDFASNKIEPVTLATKQNLLGSTFTSSILDGLMSQSLGIIATTQGLFRVGNNKNIQLERNEKDVDWTPLIVAENAGAPSSLLAVTTTNREQDITKYNGGHFYVLTGNAGGNQSRINRFAVNPLSENEPVHATTVQPFDDLFVENIPSFFLNFGRYTSTFATDGAFYFAAKNQHSNQPPQTLLTPTFPEPRVGLKNVGERSNILVIDYNRGTEINGLERSQASGSWLIAGNFGMQVLE